MKPVQIFHIDQIRKLYLFCFQKLRTEKTEVEEVWWRRTQVKMNCVLGLKFTRNW